MFVMGVEEASLQSPRGQEKLLSLRESYRVTYDQHKSENIVAYKI